MPSQEDKSKKIWVITAETSKIQKPDGVKNPLGTGPSYDDWEDTPNQGQLQQLDAQDLKRNMNEFLAVMHDVFEQAEKPQSKMQLDELELSVEINGEGQVMLLGTGGKAGAKGAIKLTFKRKDG